MHPTRELYEHEESFWSASFSWLNNFFRFGESRKGWHKIDACSNLSSRCITAYAFTLFAWRKLTETSLLPLRFSNRDDALLNSGALKHTRMGVYWAEPPWYCFWNQRWSWLIAAALHCIDRWITCVGPWSERSNLASPGSYTYLHRHSPGDHTDFPRKVRATEGTF